MTQDDFTQFLIFLICCFTCFALGSCAQRADIRKEAVKIGVAYYTANENGESTFKWINE